MGVTVETETNKIKFKCFLRFQRTVQASPLVCQMAWPNLPVAHDGKCTHMNLTDQYRGSRGRGVGRFNMVSQAQREAKASPLDYISQMCCDITWM